MPKLGYEMLMNDRIFKPLILAALTAGGAKMVWSEPVSAKDGMQDYRIQKLEEGHTEIMKGLSDIKDRLSQRSR